VGIAINIGIYYISIFLLRGVLRKPLQNPKIIKRGLGGYIPHFK
tara:strand:+ start:73 stop:204 length:132 start_codon:yes stop_codon:yes gene_type:complete